MTQRPYLIDGPMMTACERRKATIDRMARDLVAAGAFHNDDDAKRALRFAGYASLDVEILAAEARMVAMQAIVAAEMLEP